MGALGVGNMKENVQWIIMILLFLALLVGGVISSSRKVPKSNPAIGQAFANCIDRATANTNTEWNSNCWKLGKDSECELPKDLEKAIKERFGQEIERCDARSLRR